MGGDAQGLEKRCSCWREIRDRGASGKQDGPALRAAGRPCANSSLQLAFGPLLSVSASGSGSGSGSCPPVPRPPEVTPTALIIFCFCAGSVFRHQLPTVSMATRWGGGRRGYGNPRAYPSGRPLQTFPGLRVLQAGWESAPSWAATRSSVRGFPGRISAPVSALTKAGTTGPGDPGTTRLSLDLLPNPDAGAWQVERVGARKPLSPATHTHTWRERQSDLNAGVKAQTPGPLLSRARRLGPGAGEGGS